jgi:hypothetical protein
VIILTGILESVTSILKTLVDVEQKILPIPVLSPEPKPPINVGEVMDLWKYLMMIEEAIVIQKIGGNTTTDRDLLDLLSDAISTCTSQSERLKKFMENEGIPIPSLSESKPRSMPEAIPLGVKLTDHELANILAGNVYIAIHESCRNMTEAIRTDVSLMWGNFLFELVKYSAKLKVKMREREWLRIPPAYHPPGIPNPALI